MFKKLVLALLVFLSTIGSVAADSIITGSKPFTFTPGTTISSSQVNADYDYIINQVNTNGAKNGANSSITSLLGLTTPLNVASGGTAIWTATTIGGTANAITVTATTPAISSYSLTKGNIVNLQATASNTGAVTLNVNSLGVKTLFKQTTIGLVNLSGGELQTNNTYSIYYDGANYMLLNNIETTLGAVTNIASAATTDLALASGHFAFITGTTGITSFGSNANTAQPFYYAFFNGSLLITAGANLFTPDNNNVLIQAFDAIELIYLGSGQWRILSVVRSIPQLSVGQTNGLTIINNTGTPNTQIDITTTGRSILEATTGETVTIAAQTLTINAATTGANALDTGSLANTTWYYVYLIAKADGTVASLISTSSTTPTMPTGYVYKYRIGVQRTDGSAHFLRIMQKGNEAQYQVIAASTTPNYPIITSTATGSVTVPTYTSTAIGNFFPPVSALYRGKATSQSSTGGILVAPNGNFGAAGSVTNPAPCALTETGGFMSTCNWDFYPESTNIFLALRNTGSDVVFAVGWKDTVNAN